jgi:molecular chaperone DnaK
MGDIVLVDVTPLTLGVRILRGVVISLISRNTPIPIKHTKPLPLVVDMRSAVTIHVYQGERPMMNDNVTLGEINLDRIPSAARCIPNLDVTCVVKTYY